MVQSLDRGLKILEILSENEDMSISELAVELHVDKSTISRMVETLRYHDMVQISKSTKKYRLGLRVLHLATALEKNLNIIDVAKPIIRKVSDDLGQSVHLCAFNNTMTYVIDQVVRNSTFSLSATIGMIEPMHASSVGKCIMAYRREDVLEKALANYNYEKYTEKTILNKEDFFDELSKIRKQGYAIDNEEITEGVRCVAVPIFGMGNQVKYSIGISGSVILMTEEKMKLYIEHLSRAARKIGRELGCQTI